MQRFSNAYFTLDTCNFANYESAFRSDALALEHMQTNRSIRTTRVRCLHVFLYDDADDLSLARPV